MVIATWTCRLLPAIIGYHRLLWTGGGRRAAWPHFPTAPTRARVHLALATLHCCRLPRPF